MCFGWSKEPSHWEGSFDHPQHVFLSRNKKIILCSLHSHLHSWCKPPISNQGAHIPVYSGKQTFNADFLIFSSNRSFLLRNKIMEVSVNHLLLQMESNNFILSIIRFWNTNKVNHSIFQTNLKKLSGQQIYIPRRNYVSEFKLPKSNNSSVLQDLLIKLLYIQLHRNLCYQRGITHATVKSCWPNFKSTPLYRPPSRPSWN